MAQTIYKGLGDAGFAQTTATAPTVVPAPIFSFDLSDESDEAESLFKYKSGKHQATKTLETTTEFLLTITTEVPTAQLLAFGQKEIERIVGTMTIPKPIYVTIGASGTTTVSEITAGNIASAGVTLVDDGGKPLTVVGSTPSDATEVQLTAGQAQFDASLAGQEAFLILDVGITSARQTGGAGVTNFGEMEFTGTIYDDAPTPDEGIIWIPRMEQVNRANVTFDGEKFEYSMEFKPLTFGNWDVPYTVLRDIVYA